MRIALLADLHANLPAVRAVLQDAAQIGCDAIWCAGDVVGRGPHPNEVVELMRTVDVVTVQGNWDEAVGMGREVSGSIWESPEIEAHGQRSLEWTRSRLSEENMAWMRDWRRLKEPARKVRSPMVMTPLTARMMMTT